MGFTEMWFGPSARSALVAAAASVADVDGLIVEIGSWEGRSTVALANAIAPRTVHAVDTWEGSPSDVSASLAASRDVFAAWSANIAEMTAGNVVGHRMGWREFVPTISAPVALVFVDAEHTYAEVADTLVAFLPFVAPGGVLCGDDFTHPPVAAAVRDVLGLAETGHRAPMFWYWRKPRGGDHG